MIKDIVESGKSDGELVRLFGIAREYADIYLLARNRQKGCDGMGELAMVKEEFANSLRELTEYCNGRGYLRGDIHYDIDCIANELIRG